MTNELKLLPQNIEVEESILAACIIDSKYAQEVFDILKPADFYRTKNQQIFKAISCLHTQKDPIDAVTVKTELGKRGIPNGAEIISHLLDNIPMATNISHYCDIIKAEAVKRELIIQCHRTIENCHSNEPIIAILDKAQSTIMAIDFDDRKDQAVELKDEVVKSIEVYEERQKAKKKMTGIVSGFADLDFLTRGFQCSDLIILAARPSMGKTALAWEILRNASKAGHIGIIFSLEMSCQQLVDRAFAGESGVSCHRIRSGEFSNEHWIQISEAGSRLYNVSVLIDDSGGLSYQEIRRRARRYKKRYNTEFIVIDHLQLVHGDRNRSRNDEIGSTTGAMKALAKELKIPIMLLSQLNRRLEERTNKKPVLADLRDSGNIEQDADIVMFIYRPGHYGLDEKFGGETELLIAKHRK
jgi:replicative DNA helicase